MKYLTCEQVKRCGAHANLQRWYKRNHPPNFVMTREWLLEQVKHVDKLNLWGFLLYRTVVDKLPMLESIIKRADRYKKPVKKDVRTWQGLADWAEAVLTYRRKLMPIWADEYYKAFKAQNRLPRRDK